MLIFLVAWPEFILYPTTTFLSYVSKMLQNRSVNPAITSQSRAQLVLKALFSLWVWYRQTL